MATPMDTSPTTTATGSTMDSSSPVCLMVMETEALVAMEEEALEGMVAALGAMAGALEEMAEALEGMVGALGAMEEDL